jgi:hypothetical protein
MDFVKQHRGDAGKLGIGLQSREEHPVGHRDQPRRLADPAIEPRRIANARPRDLAAFAGDVFGGGARGETARDEQQYLASAPRLIEQCRRDSRRLARPRRRDEQGARAVIKRGEKGGEDRIDRKQGACHGAWKVAKVALRPRDLPPF